MSRRKVVITGVTRGLGKALTEELLRGGHSVAGCGRGQSQIQELKEQYREDDASFSVLDVADAAAVNRWALGLSKSWGIPDLLINNAALMNRQANLWELSPQEFSELIDINVKGVTYVIQAFVPLMIKEGRGVIVNMSSGWGRSTSPHVAPYCASKFAVEGLTKALAQELPSPLAAIPLSPGVIDTDMLRSCWGDEAGQHQSPDRWAKQAVPSILSLSWEQNGRSLSL